MKWAMAFGCRILFEFRDDHDTGNHNNVDKTRIDNTVHSAGENAGICAANQYGKTAVIQVASPGLQ